MLSELSRMNQTGTLTAERGRAETGSGQVSQCPQVRGRESGH
ncbi:hypothetical protein E2C01_079142 [Portunus trituberculatus]|uniref:Uncharacterized protein n=1 Tax=Portunus trituberculatus TaxID=210409 RepID=A0A5B7IW26_PORTR|nr:hypothetical protein [Portunus trituberculatus]